MNKFSNKGFGSSQVREEDTPNSSGRSLEYKIDEGDNYLFKEIQVDDISTLTRPETVWYDDSDMMVYRAASMVEEKRIKVTHKEDPNITFDCKNITEFKGRGKNVGANTVLGLYNVDRELTGEDPYTPEDFIVEPYQVIVGGEEEKAFETAKIQILRTLKETRLQYKISKIIPMIGEGACFRESLHQAKLYKGNRSETLRPLLLKRLRAWMVEELGAIDTKDLRHNGMRVECDDGVEIKANEGVVHYLKHGWYNIGVISKDKDSTNSAKLLINNDRINGKLKFPKAMHIKTTDKCAGDVALISKGEGKSKDFKFFGFKGLMYQAFLGIDAADHYSALKHLGKGFDFGDVAAYKVLKPCKTSKEALQACIDVFSDLLPNGVQYEDHKGVEHDVDTMTYMNTYFLTAYMIRKLDDPMDFYKLCAAFKVDTSKIVGNNKLTPPVNTFIGDEDHIKDLESLIKDILENNVKGLKSKKKSDQAPMIDQIKEKLESINFDSHYEMVQTEK